MIRKLSAEDKKSCLDLVPNRLMRDFEEKFLSGLYNWHAFGFFNEQDQLIGITTAYAPKDLPEWYLLAHYCDSHTELKNLLDYTCQTFESHGLYKFSWLSNDCELDFLYNFIPDRYQHHVLYSLAPMVPSKFTTHFKLLYNKDQMACASKVYTSILPESNRIS